MARRKNGCESNGREVLHVGLLVDESGSMRPMAPAVIAGINEFIGDLKADPSETTAIRASLAMFDQRGGEPPVRVRFADLPIERVRQIGPSDYQPHGATPLNDAVMRTIRAVGRRAGRDERVMIVILTDGLENASETSTSKLRAKILEREAAGWEFIYLGANQDTWAATEGIGLDRRGKHFAWDASGPGVEAALRVSGSRVKRFRDAPAEYRLEADELADSIAPGESEARTATPAERRSRGR